MIYNHTVYPRSELFSRGPVTARPSRSRQKQNVDPRKLHWFTSNVRIAHLTDHHGWNGEAFPCPVVYISWHLVSCTPHNQHFHFWLRPFAGKIALSSKATGKRNHLEHFCYCHCSGRAVQASWSYGPRVPPPLLSSPTLPASDWPVPRGGIKDTSVHSSGAVWESRWPSWAVRPNEPSGFCGRKATLKHASALVSACP